MVDPIRADLAITDTQYSLLQGLAVSIVSALLGLPAARWADAHGRRPVIIAGALGWSLATAACGLAQSFSALFAARVITGIGEVFLFPAALALIAEVAPTRRLGLAISLFALGGPVGSALALVAGGALASAGAIQIPVAGATMAGWRAAFLLCGISGVAIALLATTITEEPRPASPEGGALADLGRFLRDRWALMALLSGGMLLLSTAAFATASWAPTTLTRVHGLTTGRAGTVIGSAALIGGTLIVWLAGQLIDWRSKGHGSGGTLQVSAAYAALLTLLAGAAAIAGARAVGISLWIGVYAALSVPTVLAGAAFQQVAPEAVRAQLMALHLLLVNLVALTFGPLLVALLTERAFADPAHVGTSLGIVVCSSGLLALLCMLGANLQRNSELQT